MPDEVKRLGLDAFERIGADVTEVLERRPASLGVRRSKEAIDRHHVLEPLADVLCICKFIEAWRKRKLAEWNALLDRDDDGIEKIRVFVRQLYESHSGQARRALEKHVTISTTTMIGCGTPPCVPLASPSRAVRPTAPASPSS